MHHGRRSSPFGSGAQFPLVRQASNCLGRGRGPARSRADSVAALQAMIAEGAVAEHPAWEDLVVAENLTASLEALDAHLADLRKARSDRTR